MDEELDLAVYAWLTPNNKNVNKDGNIAIIICASIIFFVSIIMIKMQ